MTKVDLDWVYSVLEDLKDADGGYSDEQYIAMRIIEAEMAIKEALAQTEQDGECKHCTDGCPACDARKLPGQEPVAWTRTNVPSPVVKEEVMLKHPELRPHYPTPLYYAPQEWYIVEKWVAGEKRSHTRRGESLDAVYNEEVAAGVDVINVITV